MLDYLRVGVITSTHGLKGEVKVYPTTDDPKRFDDLDRVFADMPAGRVKLQVERVRYFKNLVIVKFKGIDRIEDIQPFVKHDILVSREDAVELDENEHFIGDLIGLRTVADDGRELGTLKDVLETGANNVYVIAPADDPEKELLLPAIPDVILEIDTERGFMKVHMLPGLED